MLGGGGRYSRDNPGSTGVTPAFWDTLPQGCWGGEVVPGNPRTAGVTPVYRDTLPQGCWGGEGSPGIIPGVLVLLRCSGILCYSGAGGGR